MLIDVEALKAKCSKPFELEDYQIAAIEKLNSRKQQGRLPAIVHTMGVYNNGSWKDNGVAWEHMTDHVYYNLVNRFGRALFIDGVCVNRGYLGEERCAQIEGLWLAKPVTMSKCTAPYQ